jgi:hypothetical protein
MDERGRRFSWAQILAIAAVAVAASIGASVLVQRVVLGKSDAKVHVSVLVATTVPLVWLLKNARRRRD